jgi:hypothetical protein
MQQAEILRGEEKVEDSRALYEKAHASYAACIDQGQKAPLDEILRSDIIADSCRPWSEYVEETLASLP